MNIEELNDYLLDVFNMELLDEKKQTVAEVIDSLGKGLEEQELQEQYESMKETLKDLKKYRDRYCYYAVDVRSCIWGQGFVITDEDNNYIGFIRTI